MTGNPNALTNSKAAPALGTSPLDPGTMDTPQSLATFLALALSPNILEKKRKEVKKKKGKRCKKEGKERKGKDTPWKMAEDQPK